MTKVLVVDDEQGYRDFLKLHLALEGYEVQTAATGRDAIDMGIRYRPEVLVADWLLSNHIHGLHVADVLRTVDPGLHTVLITGFGSQDLKAEANAMHIHTFIEKPFDLDDILHAVHSVARAETEPQPQLPIAVVEIDAAGIIRYANACARELLTRTSAGQHATHIKNVLDHASYARLDEAEERWLEMVPRAPGAIRWQLRIRAFPEAAHRLLVMVPENAHLTNDPIIHMLLDLPVPARLRWPFQGPALVIDDYTAHRHLTVHQLELAGCVCHTADTHDEGLRLFARDPGISVVLLADNGPTMALSAIGRLVHTLKTMRPEVPIVGTSALDRGHEFAAAGIPHFLLKPLKAEDLINELT